MQVTLTEVHANLNGLYEFDEETLTHRELHAIKMLCNLAAGDMLDALRRKDPDIAIAFAMVALARAGKIPNPQTMWSSEQVDALWDSQTGSVRIDFGEEDDAGPPDLSGNGQPNAPDDASGSSGTSTAPTSESQDDGPNPIGVPI